MIAIFICGIVGRTAFFVWRLGSMQTVFLVLSATLHNSHRVIC